MTLPLVEGETHSTGLSRSQILVGDPRVALLVLAAVIDYNLYESAGHREDIEYMNGMFALFRRKRHHQPSGRRTVTGATGTTN